MELVKKIAVILTIIGAINWGLVGLFGFDAVAFLFGPGSILSRIVYTLVGISGIYAVIIAAEGCKIKNMIKK